REAPVFASFVAILLFMMFFAQESITRIATFLSVFMEKPEEWPLDNAQDVVLLLRIVSLEAGKALAVLIVLLVVGALASSMLQNTPRFVLDRIKPKFSRISPREGWKRLFGAKGLVEFLKSLGKLLFAGIILGIAMREAQSTLMSGMITQPVIFGAVIAEIAQDIVMWIALAMLLVAGADIVWSRVSWMQDLRMTRQEVKDELKQTVGDPLVRMRIRSVQRDRARQRMMSAVPTATLVIANPTHYSIALR